MSNAKNNPSLQKQLTELDELLAWFDDPAIDVEQALEKFDYGMKLAEDIKKRLATFENKVTVLKEKFDQEV